MSSMTPPFLYQGPTDNEAALKHHYINQRLADLPTPAAIIDAAVVRRNCKLQLDTARKLGVQFRAHIKTHKTVQAAKLQAGDEGPIRLVISTVAELEHIMPWLQECINVGRSEISVLYGVPAAPSSMPRLAKLAHTLGSAKYIGLMVDHPSTLDLIQENSALFPGSVPIYLKIDTGYGRAGVRPHSETLKLLCTKLEEPSIRNNVSVLGLYSHLGQSYGFSTPLESLNGLLTEFETLLEVANSSLGGKKTTLSVGATPTATAAQLLTNPDSADDIRKQMDIGARWDALQNSQHSLEVHAGVYPFLDLQQLATHARISDLCEKNIGLSLLAEVASLYSERSKPEALIAAGSLALGREPCKSYPGWGIISPWSSITLGKSAEHYSSDSPRGWIVGRISQEHGILSWEGDTAGMRELKIGEKLLIWPNHACVTGSGFGWYYIVDSEVEEGQVVQDVWVRCRGW